MVEAEGPDTDEDLAGRRHRIGQVPRLQDLGAAVLGHDDGAHW